MAHFHRKKPWDLGDEATPEAVYWNRREILREFGLGAIAVASLGALASCFGDSTGPDPLSEGAFNRPAIGAAFGDRYGVSRNPKYTLGEDRELTPETVGSKYNNYYEFTTAKNRVWRLAQQYPTIDEWRLEITGAVEKPLELGLDDLHGFEMEERLYRFRCVERWAMQVPWTGFPLSTLLDRAKPLSKAKYVRFTSVADRDHMPGMKQPGFTWPYFESLRMDEARDELTFVALGIYGHAMPMQHGAPLRIVTPWKYGYKSPKSLVKIELLEEEPSSFWYDAQPSEYGLYSNVRPKIPHPRWSQRKERDIGTGEERDTLLYNGYGEMVAGMYTGNEDLSAGSGWSS